MNVLLDTNIVLEHLRSGVLSLLPSDTGFFISVITEAEALRYPGLGAGEEAALEKLLRIATIVSVDSRIARRAARLGRTHPAKLPDLLIAATALGLGASLVTRNIRDFRSIEGLRVFTV